MREGAERAGGRPTLGVLGGDGVVPVAALLQAGGSAVLVAEPAPPQVSEALARRYGFGLASVRCGAVPTLRQALQLVRSALSETLPEHWLWKSGDGQFQDALRPAIEPSCPTRDEAEANRRAHMAAVARLVGRVDLLVLPLSAAEALADPASGMVFPPFAPGAKPPRGHKPVPTTFDDAAMTADFTALHTMLHQVNPALRLRLLILPGPAQGHLQRLAQGWKAGLSGVLHDTVVDEVTARLALPGADPRLAALLARLIDVPDAIAALAGAIDAPGVAAAVEPQGKPRRSREERRAARAARKKDGARLVCEDELLEAFL